MPATAFRLNRRQQTLDLPPEMPLLWVLRDVLNLTGTRYGCGVGSCGACTVHVDGKAEQSCQTSLGQVAGREVTTIEGLGENGLHAVQAAWIEADAPQCGFCQAGQVMAAAALLARDPAADDAAIDAAMSANVCRCGSYVRIRAAIRQAGKALALGGQP